MKLNGRQTIYQDVEVADGDIIEATMAIIRKHVGISPDHFLKEGEVRMDDPHHRHGSIQEVTVRQATLQDVEAFALLKQLAEVRKAVINKASV